jgi:hypothetical protein
MLTVLAFGWIPVWIGLWIYCKWRDADAVRVGSANALPYAVEFMRSKGQLPYPEEEEEEYGIEALLETEAEERRRWNS